MFWGTWCVCSCWCNANGDGWYRGKETQVRAACKCPVVVIRPVLCIWWLRPRFQVELGDNVGLQILIGVWLGWAGLRSCDIFCLLL